MHRNAARPTVAQEKFVGLFNRLEEQGVSRRGFLAGAGCLAATAATAGCSDDGTVTPPTTTTTTTTTTTAYTDADILNFALNLEYLEAEFYLRGATGSGLASADTGGSSTTVTVPATTKITTTASGGALSTAQQNILNELAYTEQQHVRFLRTQLSSGAVARPAIDFVNSVAAIAKLANLPSTFNPFANYESFMTLACIFEDIGVTAYNGAAPKLSTTATGKVYLAAAAGIMAVEAYHGATLRAMLYAGAAAQGTTAYPYLGYFNSVQGVISTLSTPAGSSSGYGTLNLQIQGTGAATVASIGASNTLPNVVPADSNALAFHRTTDQVLHIAYGTLSSSGGSTSTAGVASGGFFPSGFNGNIKTTQS